MILLLTLLELLIKTPAIPGFVEPPPPLTPMMAAGDPVESVEAENPKTPTPFSPCEAPRTPRADEPVVALASPSTAQEPPLALLTMPRMANPAEPFVPLFETVNTE